jgi:hypothetical protein
VSYNVYTYFHYSYNNYEILTAGEGEGVAPIVIPPPIQKRGSSPDPLLQISSEANRRKPGKEINSIFTDLKRLVPRSKPPGK